MAATAWRRLNVTRDHRWSQPRLSEYIEGELTAGQERRLEAHAGMCPECARLVATLQALLMILPSLRLSPGAALAVCERTAQLVRARIEEWS